MDFAKKIKQHVVRIKKYWENRDFRAKTLAEKRQRYLIEKKEEPHIAFFPHNLKKKRYYYFNTVVNLIENNRERFRLPFLIIGIFLIVSSTYIVFFSPHFRISPSRVIIERLDPITDINIAYRAIEPLYGESIFSISSADVRDKILSLQKNIKSVEVSRLFPNGLKIILESERPEFTAHIPWIDKSYTITRNGVLVYEKNPDPKLPTLDIIDPVLAEDVLLDYREGARSEFMDNIILAKESLKSTFPKTNIAKFTYFKSERELHITLESGTKVLLRLGGEVRKQIELLKFYNDSNKDNINSWGIYYIDTRVVWKFFTCSDKVVCKKNLSRIYGNYYQ